LDFCDYIYEKKDENCYLDEFIQKITSTNLFNNHIDDISELLCSEQLYNLFKTKIVKYTNIRDYNTTLMWNIDFMMQYLIDDKMENDEHVQNVISLFSKINEHQE
jgi:redox-regulated HSP33 family molecular chaperone